MKNIYLLLLSLFALYGLVSCSDDEDDGQDAVSVITFDVNYKIAPHCFIWCDAKEMIVDWGDGVSDTIKSDTIKSLVAYRRGAYDTFRTIVKARGLRSVKLSGSGQNSRVFSNFQIKNAPLLNSLSLKNLTEPDILDLKNNCNLQYLELNVCNINDIDVSGCRNLESFSYSNEIYYEDPMLKYVNLSKCEKLKELILPHSHIESVDFNSNDLKKVDLSYSNFDKDALDRIFKLLPDKVDESNTYSIIIFGNPGEESCNYMIAVNKGWKVKRLFL